MVALAIHEKTPPEELSCIYSGTLAAKADSSGDS
jgi:hypothetical protein